MIFPLTRWWLSVAEAGELDLRQEICRFDFFTSLLT